MNWTGGRLSRHARKVDGSLINKQKQHFAKVRNSLLHGPKRSPAKWSIFDNITINVRRGSSERGDNQPIRMKDGSPSRSHNRSGHHHSSRKRRQDDERDHQERTKRRKISPIAQNDRHDTVKIKKETYEASAHKLQGGDVVDIDDEMEVLRRRKLRLLRDSDWLGLSLQEPLKLKYAPTGVDDNIGRRRRLKSGHEARYDKAHVRLSPARRNYDTRSEVRVTIDGKERRVGVSSSAAPIRGTAGPPMSSQSTEAMLLDGDGGRSGSEASPFPNARHENMNNSSAKPRNSKERGLNTDLANANEYSKAAPPWEDLERLADEASRKLKLQISKQASFSSSSIRKMAEERGIAIHENNAGHFADQFSSSQHSGSQILPTLLPTAGRQQRDLNKSYSVNDRRLVMPSSPPAMHHPVPRKPPSQILLKSSPDLASSTAATIGVLPQLTEDEEKGDKMWKEWLDQDAENGTVMEDASEEDNGGQSPRRAITPGVGEHIPQKSRSLAIQDPDEIASLAASRESATSDRMSNQSMPHNMMRLSSSDGSSSLSLSRTTLGHGEAVNTNGPTLAPASSANAVSSVPVRTKREPLQLPATATLHKANGDEAWKAFLQSPSEIRFDSPSPRPLQMPAIRRPAIYEKPKRKTPDPDAAWKSFVLPNESDSEDESAAFTSFWKRHDEKPSAMQRGAQLPPLSSSHASLEVHTPASRDWESLELPFSTPRTTTRAALKSHAPFLSSTTSDYFNDTQVLDDRSMYANQSQLSSTTEDLETHILDDRSMYVNQSHKSTSSISSGKAPFQLNQGAGQTMIEGFFKPPPKLRAKPPLGSRDNGTFRRPVPFGTPQRPEKQSFVDGLDRKYVQQANREFKKELWKKPNIKAEDGRKSGKKGKKADEEYLGYSIE